MEGNYRIVQTSENRFIIEKEINSYEWKLLKFLGLKIGEKKVPAKAWSMVCKKGKVPSVFELLDLKDAWYLTMEDAKKALEDIKTYPKIVYSDLS